MLKRFSFMPIPLIVATAIIIYIVDIRTIYEPHLLLPILNTIFMSGGGFTIAFMVALAYVFGAKRQALFLGGGALALGISALLAGWIFTDSPNVAVTIFSVGALLAAALHILGTSRSTEKYPARYSQKFLRQSIAILFYSSIVIFFVILSTAANRGLFPPFFVAGEGYTPTRWVIIIAYLILFFTSASLYTRLYYSSKESFLYWYSLGLAIIGIGLTIAPLAIPGSPLNWLGRIAEYLGSIYFLVAAVSIFKEARAKGIGLAQKLGNIWREPAISYRMLVNMATDAIISIDEGGKVLVWSPAAERLFGYSQNEAIGSTFASLVAADEQADPLKIQLDHPNYIDNDLAGRNLVELELRRKNAETFTAELSVSVGDTPSGRLRMAIIRDITERKKAEEELIKGSKRITDILESISDGFFALDNDWNYTYLNKRSATKVGLEPKDLIGQNFWERFSHVIGTAFEKNLREAKLKGEIKRFKMQSIRNSAEWHGYNVFPSAEGISIYWQDITEGKQAEARLITDMAALTRMHALSGKLLEPGGLQPLLQEIMDAAIAIMGAERGTLQLLEGDSLLIVAHHRHQQPFLEFFEFAEGRSSACGAAMKSEERVIIPDVEKSSLFVGTPSLEILREAGVRAVQSTPMISRKGALMGILTTQWGVPYPPDEHDLWRIDLLARQAADLIEHSQAEEALRKAHDELEIRVQERTSELKEANKALLESEASYRELTESIDDLFFAMDGELRYTYWNKASEALTGILAKDAIGKSLYELFPDAKGTEAERFYIEVLKTQQPQRFEFEYKLGEKKFTFEINAYPTKDGLSVIAKDITEKKMLEAHLLQAQRMESIGVLTGGIAHNLNNLLTPIMMSLQTLKQKLKDEQSQKLLTILERNSQRSADLIKQVLSFSRGVEGERNSLHVANIVSEIEKIAKETFPRNIEIQTNMPIDILTISGDVTQLHQVLMNLCVNARDAMPDGGVLRISAENILIDENYALGHTEVKAGSYVAISVSDTGTGIPPKIVDRIFEPFFTTKEFGKGTGLGLSTAHAIVKSHGGFIEVHSGIRKGTTFRVYLPAIETEMQNIEEQQLELLTGNGELVLVAEDEDIVREVTVSTLEKYGYDVLAANDGANAVALYAQNTNNIKVVLMDMMMPVMDGEASIRAIRKINPEVKIIIVSGLAEKDKLAKIESTRAQAILPKPYTAERLLKAMHEVLSAK